MTLPHRLSYQSPKFRPQCSCPIQNTGWRSSQLAEVARVGLSTVKDYEAGKRTPIANNLEAIQRALEEAGMRFTGDSTSGPLGQNG